MCHIRENSVYDRLYANWKSNADSARVLIAGTYYQGLAMDFIFLSTKSSGDIQIPPVFNHGRYPSIYCYMPWA